MTRPKEENEYHMVEDADWNYLLFDINKFVERMSSMKFTGENYMPMKSCVVKMDEPKLVVKLNWRRRVMKYEEAGMYFYRNLVVQFLIIFLYCSRIV
jgi:hypothetical protein